MITSPLRRSQRSFTLVELPAVSKGKRAAFTLVELLVVIGIIALLISILLPALSAARRQAAAVKCAAQLREIGNAFQMYAVESKGWYPPAQLVPNPNRFYNIDGVNYPNTSTGRTYNAMWFNFISKYVTKYKTGGAVATNQQAQLQRGTVIWGCPSWDGYILTSQIGGLSTVQTGYGMNGWPTLSVTNPVPPNSQPADPKGTVPESAYVRNWGSADPVNDPNWAISSSRTFGPSAAPNAASLPTASSGWLNRSMFRRLMEWSAREICPTRARASS